MNTSGYASLCRTEHESAEVPDAWLDLGQPLTTLAIWGSRGTPSPRSDYRRASAVCVCLGPERSGHIQLRPEENQVRTVRPGAFASKARPAGMSCACR